MKVLVFAGDRIYRRAQARSDGRKSSNVCTKENEVKEIARWYSQKGQDRFVGICHGVRNGEELDLFAKAFRPKGSGLVSIVGTDLLPRENKKVTLWDFREQKEEWLGQFTFLYSNSLDHSDRPRDTIKVWMDQLTPDGIAFIQWTSQAETVNGGDCFGAGLHEYLYLFDSVGDILDLLWIGREGRGQYYKTIIVVSRKK